MKHKDRTLRGSFYVTTFCNYAHSLFSGKPLGHQCYILHPEDLAAEREGVRLERPMRKLGIHDGMKPAYWPYGSAEQKMTSGYCFEYTGKREWRASSSEKWPVEMYTPDGSETFVGGRYIDTTHVQVWKCSDGKFRAQTTLY